MIAVRELEVRFGSRSVARIDELDVAAGEVVGVAGESGSGKSITALAILGLAPFVGATVTGSVRLDGRELVGLPERELRAIRGRRIGMIMQSPRASLNPTIRLGQLMARTMRLHDVPKAEVAGRIDAAFRSVLLDSDLLDRYPHEVSGGQAQRFAIALVLALGSEVVIADEPTSALDVTVQAEVVDLLRRVREERGAAQVFISHDLAVIGQLADRIVVMRAGVVVESGPTATVLGAPAAAYTRELVAAIPRIGAGGRGG